MSNITSALKIDLECHRIEKIENALVSAICIIQHEAGLSDIHDHVEHGIKLMKWCEELKQESGIDFDLVLARITQE